MPLALLFMVCAAPSFAELGGTVAKEAVQIKEQSSIVATDQTLNVYQVKMPSGTQIKEYANADGVVVAVTWQGPTLPNLKVLLGDHFDEFANRKPSSLAINRRSAAIHTDDLVVQSHGQMRSFAGFAYLPKLLPPGFNLDQIK